jgi:hypothetical protein
MFPPNDQWIFSHVIVKAEARKRSSVRRPARAVTVT